MPSSTSLIFRPPFPDAKGLKHVHQVMGDAGFILQKQEDLSDHRSHANPRIKYTYQKNTPASSKILKKKIEVLKDAYKMDIQFELTKK